MYCTHDGLNDVEYIHGKTRNVRLSGVIGCMLRYKSAKDIFPLEALKGYYSAHNKIFHTYPSDDQTFSYLVDNAAYGDALILAACIYRFERRTPDKTYLMCAKFIIQNFKIDFSKYEPFMANDIRQVFVISFNNHENLDLNFEELYKDYISQDDVYCLHEYDDGFDDEEDDSSVEVGKKLLGNEDGEPVFDETEWVNRHDIYKYYLPVLDKNGIIASDKLTYNQVYRIHFSGVEKAYSQQLAQSGVVPSKLVHNLVNKGFYSSAHTILCELAEIGFMSKEGREYDEECLLEDPAFLDDVRKILLHAEDLSIYWDKLYDHIVKYNNKNVIFTEDEMKALLDKQTELHLEYD